MAIKMINQDYCPCLNAYKKDYIVDTEADVSNLPVCCTGSSALVVASGAVYIVNASGKWVVFGG